MPSLWEHWTLPSVAELFWGLLWGLAVILFFPEQKFRQEPWGDEGLSRTASAALRGGRPGLWAPEGGQCPGVPMAVPSSASPWLCWDEG